MRAGRDRDKWVINVLMKCVTSMVTGIEILTLLTFPTKASFDMVPNRTLGLRHTMDQRQERYGSCAIG